MNQQTALIVGNGMDSAHLSNFLLDKDYKVIIGTRRSGSSDNWRLKELGILQHPNLKIEAMDLTEFNNVKDIVEKYKFDEIFNLGAQSFVQSSFGNPYTTNMANYMGHINLLEVVRHYSPKSKIYFAASSEMYGKVQEIPQKETTPFYPRSPYGVSKLASYWMGVNYRESHNMFICNGILFNHETMASFLPVFIKDKNSDIFDIKPIEELYEFDKNTEKYQESKIKDIQVWGKDGWVDVTYASAYPHNIKDDNKKPKIINGRCGAYLATGSHVAFLKDREEKTENIKIGNKFEVISLPKNNYKFTNITLEEAELIGMLVADGYFDKNREKTIRGKFTKNDKDIQKRFRELWCIVTGDTNELKSQETESGFKKGNYVTQIIFSSKCENLLKYNIYNKDRTKRIPIQILNSSEDVQLAFLKSYNRCDGLKAGHCKYEFKSFKTNSATLAQGLWYLTDNLLPNQKKTLSIEFKKEEKKIYYSINLGSDINSTLENNKKIILNAKKEGMSQRELHRETKINRGFIRKIWKNEDYVIKRHLEKDFDEIKKIIDFYNYDGWFYDITTSSKEFCCGVGNIHIHNSPLRGEEFVTRKITKKVAEIKYCLENNLSFTPLVLGNMDAKRDWSYAGDMVEGMWLMLQYNKPDDYVLCSGDCYMVREFVDYAFYYAGIPIAWEGKGIDEKVVIRDFFGSSSNGSVLVEVSPEFFRPAEVDILIGDCTKAKEILNWKPKYSFSMLVESMVKADIERTKSKKIIIRDDCE